MSSTIFRRASKNDRDYQFSCLQGYFTCSYRQLVDIFGEPDPDCASSDGKVSTEWIVTDGKQFFTIYDYKGTDLYDDSNPSVAEFRALPSYEWHIGGSTKPVALVAFLEDAIANGVRYSNPASEPTVEDYVSARRLEQPATLSESMQRTIDAVRHVAFNHGYSAGKSQRAYETVYSLCSRLPDRYAVRLVIESALQQNMISQSEEIQLVKQFITERTR